MPRLNFVLDGEIVGRIEYTGSSIVDDAASQSNHENVGKGIAVTATFGTGEISLVFPFNGDSIDLSHPMLRQWPSDEGGREFIRSEAIPLSAIYFRGTLSSGKVFVRRSFRRAPSRSKFRLQVDIRNESQRLDVSIGGTGHLRYLHGHIHATGQSIVDSLINFDAVGRNRLDRGYIRIVNEGGGSRAWVSIQLLRPSYIYETDIVTEMRGDLRRDAIKRARSKAEVNAATALNWFLVSIADQISDNVSSDQPSEVKLEIWSVKYWLQEEVPLTAAGLIETMSGLSTAMLAEVAAGLLDTEQTAATEYATESNADDLARAIESEDIGIGAVLAYAHRLYPERQLYRSYFSDSFKTDGRLITEFRYANTTKDELIVNEKRIPVLVEVSSSDWEPTFGSAETLGRIGSTVAMRVSASQLEHLQSDPKVISIEASPAGGRLECEKSVPLMNAPAVHKEYSEKGDKALVALVDDGIDILHGAFLDTKGRTRILAIWDQRDETGPSPPGFSFGTFHDKTAIRKYVAEQVVPDMLGRNQSTGHGTHVASIAAGQQIGPFAGGAAPEAAILVVIPRLDCDVEDPHSVGYSISHGLALDFIRRFASEHDLPTVVNLSIGMNAGPHDGQSRLERDIEVVSNEGTLPGYVIVKSAGNDRDRRGHATVSVRTNCRESLSWSSPYPLSYESRQKDVIEIWSNCVDDVEFYLMNPMGETSKTVSLRATDAIGEYQNGNQYDVTYKPVHATNGDSQLLITIVRGAAQHISPGTWTLHINARRSRRNVTFDAWIDMIDLQPIEFNDSHVSEERTLSIPGTARSVITVGAVLPTPALQLGAYSAFGPTRDGRNKPEVVAPGNEIFAAEAGTESGVVAMSGTSMAAPHVSGAIALLLSQAAKHGQRLTAKQVQSQVVEAVSGDYLQWDRGLGYGLPDTYKLLLRSGLKPSFGGSAPQPLPGMIN